MKTHLKIRKKRVMWCRRPGPHSLHLMNCHESYKSNGSGALSGKMLLVRIVENNKMYAYFRAA